MSEPARFQYSLRSLFVLTTMCAVFFAILRTFGVDFTVALVSSVIIYGALAFPVLLMRRRVVQTRLADPLSLHRVAWYANDMEAALAVDALQEAGIRATAVGGYTSGFRAEAPGEVHVLVAQQDVDRARETLAQLRTDEEQVDWSQVDVGETREPADGG